MSKYFIAYAYFASGGAQGFGNIEVDRAYPIASTADITELTDAITDAVRREMRVPTVNIVILNFREFEPDIERQNYGADSKDNVVSIRPKS